ncbi:MAG: DinB family protein [Calditrichota bacterium]
MFTSIQDFTTDYKDEREGTLKILGALTDASLAQKVAADHRNLGRIAWHLVTSYPEMTSHAGLSIKAVDMNAPVPSTAALIKDAYAAASQEMLDQITASWTDATLQEEKNFYGANWKLGFALEVLIRHEVHHRAQMTVLMRQAGLKVPGVYGPALEEWAKYGAPAPEV